VAYLAADTVSMFKPGSTTPDATLTGLDGPAGLAIDANNNLYVSNQGHSAFVATTTVSVFARASGGGS
jgi:hypothetical protein